MRENRKHPLPHRQRVFFSCPPGRGCIVGDVFQHILHPAVQDAAELLHRVGADALIPLEPSELAGAHAVFFDEGILGDAAGAQSAPEWGKGYNSYKFRAGHLPRSSLPLPF